MEFYDFHPTYEFIKRAGLSSRTALEWYDDELKRTMVDAFYKSDQQARGQLNQDQAIAPVIGNIQMACERDWEEHKKPYYKVFPNLLPYFVDTKLDVPSEFFQLPFPAFVIRLPSEHDVDILRIDDKHYVKSILVGGNREKVDGVMFGSPSGAIETNNFRHIMMFVDVNESEPNAVFGMDSGIPVLTYKQLLFENDEETVETALKKNESHCSRVQDGYIKDGGVDIPLALTDACLRIAVAVTFLATGGDKIVECDVLNRDLLRYLDAKKRGDTEKQTRIVTRARRNRKHGFTMGREITLPGRTASHTGEGEGQVLQHQHQRGAHWHWVRHGPGKAKMKLMFFGQITVRPDLPADPNARRGYKTK